MSLINRLGQGLGKLSLTDIQGLSGRPPKPLFDSSDIQSVAGRSDVHLHDLRRSCIDRRCERRPPRSQTLGHAAKCPPRTWLVVDTERCCRL